MIDEKLAVNTEDTVMPSRRKAFMPYARRSMVIIRMKQVIEKTGLSRSTIYARLDKSSTVYDSTFPKQVNLCPESRSRSGAVGWFEEEIDEWLAGCAMQREAGSNGSTTDKHDCH